MPLKRRVVIRLATRGNIRFHLGKSGFLRHPMYLHGLSVASCRLAIPMSIGGFSLDRFSFLGLNWEWAYLLASALPADVLL